jgi:hypothetical protein
MAFVRFLRPGLAALVLALGCSTHEIEPTTVPVAARADAPEAVVMAETCQPLHAEPPEVTQGPDDNAVPPIQRPEALASFYDAAAAVLRGTARDHVRIAVYGDSNLASDYLTGHMRRWLQGEHGDAGHGFVALARPWSHYLHMDVKHGSKDGWNAYCTTTYPIPDHVYGLGGIVAESYRAGAKAFVETAGDKSPIGGRVSNVEIYFLKGKLFGRFHVLVDGQRLATLDAHAEEKALGVHRFEIEDGPHRIEFESAEQARRTRLLGAVLERRDKPSFVVDSFGVGALNSLAHAREDPDINRAMLRERRYDLVVFATGSNDPFTLPRATEAMDRLIKLQREALPGVPILLLTPTDRGQRRTFPGTLLVVTQRQEVAAAHKTALWDQFVAMGGPNGMASFRRRGLAYNDFIHYTEAGGAYIAKRLLHALWRGLEDHLESHPQAGCSGDRGRPWVAKSEGVRTARQDP